jgi:hypothetical protein
MRLLSVNFDVEAGRGALDPEGMERAHLRGIKLVMGDGQLVMRDVRSTARVIMGVPFSSSDSRDGFRVL